MTSPEELAEEFDSVLVAAEDAFIVKQQAEFGGTWAARDEWALRMGYAAGSHDAIKLTVDSGYWKEPK